MAENPPLNEDQLVLLRDHLSHQKEELAARLEQSRAEEKLESQRISTEADLHKANLAHAETVLSAKATDRKETREFWRQNLSKVFWLIAILLIMVGVILITALFQGKANEVIDLIKSLGGYAIAAIAGAGLDRAWRNRKKTGISSGNRT